VQGGGAWSERRAGGAEEGVEGPSYLPRFLESRVVAPVVKTGDDIGGGEDGEESCVVKRKHRWWRGGVGGVDGEEPCVAEALNREERTGRRRHESGSREGSAQRKGEARIATS
jgi:hypothetical protein